MAQVRFGNGEFVVVSEDYEEAAKRLVHALQAGEAFVLTLVGGGEYHRQPGRCRLHQGLDLRGRELRFQVEALPDVRRPSGERRSAG